MRLLTIFLSAFGSIILFHHCEVSSQEAIFADLDRTDICCRPPPSILDFNFFEDSDKFMIDIKWSRISCPDDYETRGYIITYGCNRQDMLAFSDLISANTCNLGSPSMTLELPEIIRNVKDWECVFSIQGVVRELSTGRECVTTNGTCAIIAASSYMISNETCIEQSTCPQNALSGPLFLPTTCLIESKAAIPTSAISISMTPNDILYLDNSTGVNEVCVNEAATCQIGQVIEVCREYELHNLRNLCGSHSRLFRTKIVTRTCEANTTQSLLTTSHQVPVTSKSSTVIDDSKSSQSTVAPNYMIWAITATVVGTITIIIIIIISVIHQCLAVCTLVKQK